MRHVMIIDRNPSLAEALAVQLSLPKAVECRGVSDMKNCVGVVQTAAPDLVILDPVHLPLQRESELAAFCVSLRRDQPELKLLCYSFDSSSPMIEALMTAGFQGALSKSCQLDQLEVAIAACLGGGVYFDEVFAAKFFGAQQGSQTGPLSTREKEVLVRIAKGLAGKQIAFDLSISAKTVETYKARAIQKLGLTDRSKVVEYALEQGWIS